MPSPLRNSPAIPVASRRLASRLRTLAVRFFQTPSARAPSPPKASLILLTKPGTSPLRRAPKASATLPMMEISGTKIAARAVLIVEKNSPIFPLVVSQSWMRTMKSPTAAVRARKPPAPFCAMPKRLKSVVTTEEIMVCPTLKIANTPAKVRLRRSMFSGPILSPAAKSRKFSVISASLLPVIGGKIWLKASLRGVRTDRSADQLFFSPSMSAFRPPASFPSDSILFLASCILPRKVPT